MVRKRKKRQSLAMKSNVNTVNDENDRTSSSSFTAAKAGATAPTSMHLAKPGSATQGDTSAFVSNEGNAAPKGSRQHGTPVIRTTDASIKPVSDVATSTPGNDAQAVASEQRCPNIPSGTPQAIPSAIAETSTSRVDPVPERHDLEPVLPLDTQASTGGMRANSCSTDDRDASKYRDASKERNASGPAGRERMQRASPIPAILQGTPAHNTESTPQRSSTAQEHGIQRNTRGIGPAGRIRAETESLVTISLRKRGKKRKRVDSSTGEPQPPTSRDQSSYRLVRLLLRLGLLPVASLIDSFWLSALSRYASEHLLQHQYTAGNIEDPFKDLRLPTLNNSIPGRTKDLDGRPDVFDRYKTLLAPVRNDIVATARAAMLSMARLCLGEPDQHERHFARFDALECCKRFRPRCLLYGSQKLLASLYGEEQGKELYGKFSAQFPERAGLGLDLLTIVFAGILTAFRNSWDQSRGKSLRRYGSQLLSDKLVQRVFETSGPPSWSRPWVRALLFSCTFEEGMEETDEDRIIQNIGANLELICVLQLATVMHMDENKLENYRKENLQDAPFTVESKDKGTPMQVIFSAAHPSTPKPHNLNGTTVQYSMKSGVYPWNKVIRWDTNLSPITKAVADANGGTKMVKHSRYQEMHELITEERGMMKKYTKRVELQAVLDAKTQGEEKNLMDIIADLIVQRGASVFKAPTPNPMQQSTEPSSESDQPNMNADVRAPSYAFALSD